MNLSEELARHGAFADAAESIDQHEILLAFEFFFDVFQLVFPEPALSRRSGAGQQMGEGGRGRCLLVL